ncbi:NAD(P)-dependent dehydrogenase (short-subunit alcohol dehydrogenase family) [Chitinophaga skermanii]|uniref:NAD(P)-dependent dehydrogenase (Short-subunit alcohol dehydrogenase family) n=1 Tax=Chitinophaga skermanii TaxID=331697 RepID=A0A327QAR7_9BACT|nr:SDR family oxidoreductase [Chitinophaga skermanii]RAJ01629.1 NAD(P)-dependent dehydrogenase (short-subunit alcohol dehydrogenase family) [Chitinophaga skermanii]
MQKSQPKKAIRPKQKQLQQPGLEAPMKPQPLSDPIANGSGKLQDRVAIITGGDSGIGKAVALAFTAEGAKVTIAYLNEKEDAEHTKELIEALGGTCLLIAGDITKETHCKKIIDKTIQQFGRLDILVNNAAVQYPQKNLEDISTDQLIKTFSTNIFAQFYLCKAAIPHLKKGASIINTTSVTAYRGSGHLIDYSATKGAIVSFTRSLSSALADKGIRVNAVAPGPIWTPLIPATFTPKEVETFGSDVPLKRAGQPAEVATSYVFLASDDATYFTGQILHPNGGEIVNG